MFKSTSLAVLVTASTIALSACTQESQNKLGRSLQNWTGTDGVLEVYAGSQVVRRFMKIDKLSTATEKVYFEFSDYSTPYVFFEQP